MNTAVIQVLLALAPSLSPVLALQASPQVSGLAALDAQAPTPLPAGTLIMVHLFEQPLVLLAIIVGVTTALVAVLNRRGLGRRAAFVGSLGVFLAAAVFAASRLIITPAEQMAQHARELVAMTAAGDADAVRGELTADAALLLPHLSSPENRDQIVARVRNELRPGGAIQVKEYRVLIMQSHEDSPGRGRVQLKLSSTPASVAYRVPSWWRLDYEKQSDGGWNVSGISLISLGGGIR